MPKERLQRETVAAWVLKASPSIFDVEAAIADGSIPFSSCRLNPTYRVDLIAVGDPVLLWISGPDRGFRAGGHVTGPAALDRGGTRHWVDAAEKSKLRPYLPVELSPISKIDEAELLLDRRFGTCEVVRARNMGNPSYLTDDELDVVLGLVDEDTKHRLGSRFDD